MNPTRKQLDEAFRVVFELRQACLPKLAKMSKELNPWDYYKFAEAYQKMNTLTQAMGMISEAERELFKQEGREEPKPISSEQSKDLDDYYAGRCNHD